MTIAANNDEIDTTCLQSNFLACRKIIFSGISKTETSKSSKKQKSLNPWLNAILQVLESIFQHGTTKIAANNDKTEY